MKFEKGNQPYIRNTLYIVFFILAISLIFSGIIIFGQKKKVNNLHHQLETASSKALHSKDIQQYFLNVFDGSSNDKIDIENTVKQYAIFQKALKIGGVVNLGGQKVPLKIDDKVIAKQVQTIDNFWSSLKYKIELILHLPLFDPSENRSDEILPQLLLDLKNKNRLSAQLWNESEKNMSFEDFEEKLQSEINAYMNQYVVKMRKDPQVKELFEEVVTDFFRLDQLDSELIRIIRKQYEEQNTSFNEVLAVIIVINLILILFCFLLMRYLILKPIQLFNTQLKQGALLREPIGYNRENELGQMATSVNHLIERLNDSISLIDNVSKGIYNSKNLETTDDLSKVLNQLQNKFKQLSRDEEDRKWTSEGINLFVELLRDNKSEFQELCYQIIYNLVKYIKASQGAIYIINDERENEIQAQMVACYAYDRRKYLSKKFDLGEGLIGQVMREKTSIFMNELPKNYHEITSGLGAAKPNALLIVPLKINEQLVGIIELSLFKELPTYQIAFVERLAENIASTLSNLSSAEKTKKLLQESRAYAQQLRLQEEETRQNVEELQAIQEDMKKNEEVLLAQSFAISSTLMNVEYDLNGKIIYANDLFLEKMKYQWHEIDHQKHALFLENNEDDPQFWQKLSAGLIQSGESCFIDKNGEKVWLKTTYVPISGDNKRSYKIIQFAFDITPEKQELLNIQHRNKAFQDATLVIDFDLSGHITYVNSFLLELLNYPISKIVGLQYDVIMGSGEHDKAYFTNLWRKIKSGEYISGKYEFISNDDESLWIEGSFNPIMDAEKHTQKITFIGFNITSQKLSEEKIKKSLSLASSKSGSLDALVKSTNDIVFTIDNKYNFTFISAEAVDYFAEKGKKISIGSNLLEVLDQKDYNTSKSKYDEVLNGSITTEELVERSGRKKAHYQISYLPIQDAEQTLGVLVHFKDITLLKETENALLVAQRQMEENEIRLNNLLNGMEDMVVSFNKRSRINAFNTLFKEAMAEHFNWDVKEGDFIVEKLHDNEKEWKDFYEAVLSGKTSIKTIQIKDQEYEIHGKPIVDHTEAINGGIILFRNK